MKPLLALIALLAITATVAAQTPVIPAPGEWTTDTIGPTDSGYRTGQTDTNGTAVGVIFTGSSNVYTTVIGTVDGWQTSTHTGAGGSLTPACIASGDEQEWAILYRTGATQTSFALSTDGGATFGTPVAIPAYVTGCILKHGGGDDWYVLGLAASAARLYYSNDNGATWNNGGILSGSPTLIAGLTVPLQYAYAGTSTALHRYETTDSGLTWIQESTIINGAALNKPHESGGVMVYWSNNDDDLQMVQVDGSSTYTNTEFFDGANINHGIAGATTATGSYFAHTHIELGNGTLYLTVATDATDPQTSIIDETGTASNAPVSQALGEALYVFDKDSSDNIRYWYNAGPFIPELPITPTGLSGLVTSQCATSGPNTSSITLRWPISTNDPNRDEGNFTYTIYIDGVNQGTDPTTSADGNGFREATISIDGPSCQQATTFQVTATNAGGDESAKSCAISINPGTLLDSDQCGTGAQLTGNIPVGQGGLLDIQPLADGLNIPVTALGWIIGVALTVGLGIAGFFAIGPLGAAGGAALGTAAATGLGWFPLWLVVFLVLMVVGVYIFTKGRE